jgi:hypothetical protein
MGRHQSRSQIGPGECQQAGGDSNALEVVDSAGPIGIVWAREFEMRARRSRVRRKRRALTAICLVAFSSVHAEAQQARSEAQQRRRSKRDSQRCPRASISARPEFVSTTRPAGRSRGGCPEARADPHWPTRRRARHCPDAPRPPSSRGRARACGRQRRRRRCRRLRQEPSRSAHRQDQRSRGRCRQGGRRPRRARLRDPEAGVRHAADGCPSRPRSWNGSSPDVQ